MPKDTGVDGSGSCRTFVAVYCELKKMLVHKNMPCRQKVLKSSEQEMTAVLPRSKTELP